MLGRSDHLYAVSTTSCSASSKNTHVHNQDASLVEPVHDFLGRHADGTDEQLCLLLDDHSDEIIKVALCVIVVGLARSRAERRKEQVHAKSCRVSLVRDPKQSACLQNIRRSGDLRAALSSLMVLRRYFGLYWSMTERIGWSGSD
jgi:hypothetical protein